MLDIRFRRGGFSKRWTIKHRPIDHQRRPYVRWYVRNEKRPKNDHVDRMKDGRVSPGHTAISIQHLLVQDLVVIFFGCYLFDSPRQRSRCSPDVTKDWMRPCWILLNLNCVKFNASPGDSYVRRTTGKTRIIRIPKNFKNIKSTYRRNYSKKGITTKTTAMMTKKIDEVLKKEKRAIRRSAKEIAKDKNKRKLKPKKTKTEKD